MAFVNNYYYNHDPKLIELLELIVKKLHNMANELDNLTTEVEETKTVAQSAIVLLQGLKAKLDAAGTDPVKLKALSDSLNSTQQELADAIVANTPSEGEPTQP